MRQLDEQRERTEGQQQEGDVRVGDDVEEVLDEVGVVVDDGRFRRLESDLARPDATVTVSSVRLLKQVLQVFGDEVDDVSFAASVADIDFPSSTADFAEFRVAPPEFGVLANLRGGVLLDLVPEVAFDVLAAGVDRSGRADDSARAPSRRRGWRKR